MSVSHSISVADVPYASAGVSGSDADNLVTERFEPRRLGTRIS